MHLIGFSEKEIEHDEETMWFQWRKLSKGTYPDTFLVKFTNSNDKKNYAHFWTNRLPTNKNNKINESNTWRQVILNLDS